MKQISPEYLRRLKRAMQKTKMKSIDLLRMQVNKCDQEDNKAGTYIDQNTIQHLEKDEDG